jgi:hypothetical protein
MTAVSVGRHDTTHTYTLEDVCLMCHNTLTKAAEEAQRRARWRTFWILAFMGNIVLAALLPVGLYPFYAAVIVRNGWKWWAKQPQRLTLGQTAQQVPQTMAPSAAEERTKSNTSS